MRDLQTGLPEGFGGLVWKDITNIHPIGLAAVLIFGVAMLLLPRRWAVLPMTIIACFIPSAQRITVFNLDFNLLRIMVLFGATRMVLHGEMQNLVWKPLDTAMVLWVISAIVMNTLLMGTISDFVNRLGFAFDALGMYFLFRCLIRDWQDVDRLVTGCIMISIPVAVFFLVEKTTGRNVFSVFGGVPEITTIRQGRLRCQGAFSHPILAGCFWAALMPLFAAQWWKKGSGKFWAVVGVSTSMLIVITCASSTPVMAAIAAMIGGVMFFCRRYMKPIRWGVVLTLIALHIVMKAPVWHLIARVSAVGGSTGHHRYLLIDQAIKHFSEWWLMGTMSTLHWKGLFDITNQYILEGVKGGLLTLALFVTVIVLAFRGVGRLWRISTDDKYKLALSWALGVSLFVHCMNFIGVSYFGQIYIVWYLILGIIGSMSPETERLRHWTPAVIQNLTQQRNTAVKIPQLNGRLGPYDR